MNVCLHSLRKSPALLGRGFARVFDTFFEKARHSFVSLRKHGTLLRRGFIFARLVGAFFKKVAHAFKERLKFLRFRRHFKLLWVTDESCSSEKNNALQTCCFFHHFSTFPTKVCVYLVTL